MAKTKQEVLAFVYTLSKGPPAIHLEAVLGRGNVPSVEDFERDTPGAIKRAEELCDLLEENIGCLRGLIETNKARFEKRKQESKRSTLPGVKSDVEHEEELEEARDKMRRVK